MHKSNIKNTFVSGLRSQVSGLMVRLATCDMRLVAKGCFLLLFVFCILGLSGCATYKFQRGKKPYDLGYVASRDDYAILEYTIGKDNNVPGLKLAKERFNRRRKIVEHYYKKMGYIENHFKMVFLNPPIMCAKFIKGIFRLPFVAIADYRYEHNPKYKKRIKRIEEEGDRREETRVNKLKDELNIQIKLDIAAELETKELEKAEDTRPVQEVITETLVRIEQEAKQPPEDMISPAPIAEQPPLAVREKPGLSAEELSPGPDEGPASSKIAELSSGESALPASVEQLAKKPSHLPVAVIIAKPNKGFSPLKVRFYGSKSYAPKGRIVSYAWDFGDGDTSTQASPTNTYYSGSLTPQYFTVTLKVQDDQGGTAETTATIEVLNK